MGQATLAQGSSSLQARQDQADGAEHEIGARATRDTHHLLAVDGQVVAQHTKTEAEGDHVQAYQPPLHEEEAVPRQLLLVPHGFLLRQLHGRIHHPTTDGYD